MHSDGFIWWQISASYVPLVHRASLESADQRFTVICSQAVGVASLAAGQIELMLHRSLMEDDGRGLGEGARSACLQCDAGLMQASTTAVLQM